MKWSFSSTRKNSLDQLDVINRDVYMHVYIYICTYIHTHKYIYKERKNSLDQFEVVNRDVYMYVYKNMNIYRKNEFTRST